MALNDPLPGRSVLGLRRADQIVSRATPWLIDGWLVEGTLAGLVAPSSTCKSFLAIDWACCIATGTPWNGHAVKKRAVCYLAGEGLHGLRKRIAAWEIANGISIKDAPLYLSASLPFLCNDLSAIASIDEMNEVTLAGPGLVIIDTVARAMGGANENSAEHMSALIRSMDWFKQELGATVLSVHHTGNNPSNQTRARGSSAYRAALDSEFLLKAVGAHEIELSVSKSKDWSAEAALRLRKVLVPIELEGQDESSLVLRLVTSIKTENARLTQVLALRAQGLSIRKIADELKLNRSMVERLLKPHGKSEGETVAVVSSRPPYTGGADETASRRDTTAETVRDVRDGADERCQGPRAVHPGQQLAEGGLVNDPVIVARVRAREGDNIGPIVFERPHTGAATADAHARAYEGLNDGIP